MKYTILYDNQNLNLKYIKEGCGGINCIHK